jgi:predicted nuclease of predicted toxin-antitoxin system
MKFLLDMNLSPDWLTEFSDRGIKAVHWSQIGHGGATDEMIMKYARENEYIVFTHDLDFGAMLAATNAASPSVIQIRVQDVSPQSLAARFFTAVNQFQNELLSGALVIIDARKDRVRVCPSKNNLFHI